MRVQNIARLLLDQRFYLALLIVVSIAVGLTAHDLGDFNDLYHAGQALRTGVNPYTISRFFSPLHVALLFMPLSLLPIPIAFHLYSGLVFGAFGLAFYLLTQRRIGMTLLLMCSPLPLWSAWYGNIEGLALLGAALPPAVGIWLVLLKPQIGLVVALVWAWQRWLETRSVYAVTRLVLPVGAVLAISLMAGMLSTTPSAAVWNISLWPFGLIIGIPAVFLALYAEDIHIALFAGPFLSPYLGGPASYVGVLPVLTRNKWAALAGVIASWIVLIVWRMKI